MTRALAVRATDEALRIVLVIPAASPALTLDRLGIVNDEDVPPRGRRTHAKRPLRCERMRWYLPSTMPMDLVGLQSQVTCRDLGLFPGWRAVQAHSVIESL